MTAIDADGGSFGAITYSIGSGPSSSLPAVFSINKETGHICTSAVLDRDEGSESYEFTVTATDGVSERFIIRIRYTDPKCNLIVFLDDCRFLEWVHANVNGPVTFFHWLAQLIAECFFVLFFFLVPYRFSDLIQMCICSVRSYSFSQSSYQIQCSVQSPFCCQEQQPRALQIKCQ